MTSHITDDFTACYNRLPDRIKKQAKKAYKLWKKDPEHPGLEFKKVSKNKPVYSVRITLGWRVIGVKHKNEMIWFWIGSHADYEKVLSKL